MSKSCVLPPPLRLFEVVLVIDVLPLVMEMVEVKVISLVTTQVFPPAVAQLERAEKVETEDVARSRGCGKSWPNGCLVLPVLFNVDARPWQSRSCTQKKQQGEKRKEPAHEGSPWAGARLLDGPSLQVPEGAASELKTAAVSVSGRGATECEGGRD